jgi:hypothetical protein
MISALGVIVALAAAMPPPAGTGPAVHVSGRIRARAAADGDCLREAVTGFLAREGVNVDWLDADATEAAPSSERQLSVEIDLSEPGRAALAFADSAGGPKRTRDVPLAKGLDEVGCESLADVIASSVLAMAATPVAPPSPSPSPPPPTAVETVRPDAAFDGHRHVVTVAYTLEPVASDALQSGVEVGFGFPPMPTRHRQWLKLWYRLPVAIDADTASVRWSSLAALWAVSLSSRGRRFWFEAASHFGLSATFVEQRFPTAATGSTSNQQTKVGPEIAWDVTAGLRVAGDLAVFATLRLSLAAGREVNLDQNGVELFNNWSWLRPGLVLGARWQ